MKDTDWREIPLIGDDVESLDEYAMIAGKLREVGITVHRSRRRFFIHRIAYDYMLLWYSYTHDTPWLWCPDDFGYEGPLNDDGQPMSLMQYVAVFITPAVAEKRKAPTRSLPPTPS